MAQALEAGYDLRGEIRGAIKRSRTADPYRIAETVAKSIPDEELRAVVADLLPDAVREAMRIQRNGSFSVKGNASSRWEGVRNVFRDAVAVDGEWRFFGELTADDLEALAEERFANARRSEAKGKQYLRLAEELRARKAERVRDLPPEVVAEVLS